MYKVKVIDRRSEFSIISERNLLSKLKHPFIVNMHFAFQDFSKLYLVMDLLTGGDLRYHIAKRKTFTEQQTKFFIANLILSLEYIHSQKIIHRDIKPENLVLDSKGYVRLTDFGVAKINEPDNSSETSGTPGYMAPEVILIQNHSYAADFFALGVIGYEFMMGYRPYLGRSRKEIKDLIISKQAKIRKEELPEGWGIIAANFINGLLQRKPNKRLGYQNISEIKENPWMEDIDWDLLSKKELEAPFLPYSNKENYDKEYCEGEEKIGEDTLERYDEYIQSEYFEGLFPNYTYVDMDQIYDYQKTYNNANNENNINNSNNIYNKTNYNRIITDNDNKNNNLIIKSKNSTHSSSKNTNSNIIQNNTNLSKKENNNNYHSLNEENIKPNKDLSIVNQKMKLLNKNNSKKSLQIKKEPFTKPQKEKPKFDDINLKSLKNIVNNNKEKKLKKGKGMIITTMHKFLLKNNNKNIINFNATKNIFLNKSNSVKMINNNKKDLMHYKNLINKKTEDSNTANSSNNKYINEVKNVNNKKDKLETINIQQYLNNKAINKNGLNLLINAPTYVHKKHRNKSQRDEEEFKKKIESWLNDKEKSSEHDDKKGKLRKSKNAFLNSNINVCLNKKNINNINNINTIFKNKNINLIVNNNNKNSKNIINNKTNEKKNMKSNNINININNKDNETIINNYHHPKFNNINIKKNKLFNYLSNPNIHKNNNIQNNKFPFIYNINTFSNYPKNLLTININDSYSKDLINGKVINVHNNNFLTANDVRQGQGDKNIRNIIVNNISPTVNVLIHSEEKKISKKKKINSQKRVNPINIKSKYNTVAHDNHNERNEINKKTKNVFNGINQKYYNSKKKI